MNSTSQSFLGRYRLVKVLGQGAMGVVYEGVDTRLNRTVAIKTVLRSHLADETTANEYATRFEREAQAAARLSHPHVVTVYDFGEHEDISYIVMEFVRGRELNQAFEAGEKFPLPEAVRIMRELLLALDYAHQQGIVHRDVKPANVMLDAAGRVKLTDFGVARVTNANQDRTMPGTLVGTPSYMSPEQILGLAVGSRTDIFAAGVILYQFLVGRRPFTGGGPFGVQRKIVQDDPDPPSRLNPDVPQGFDIIVLRALAKQPDQRYETAAAFAADLERIGASLPRAVPLIDLDLPAEGPAPAATPKVDQRSPPTLPPPKAPPAYDPSGPTLFTEVPFAKAPAQVPIFAPAPVPTLAPTPAPAVATAPEPTFDPEATIIMFRPSVPPAMASPAQQLTPPPVPPAPSPRAPATAPVHIAMPEMLTQRPAPTAPAPRSAGLTGAQAAAANNAGAPLEPTARPPPAPATARTAHTPPAPAPAAPARPPPAAPTRKAPPATAAGRGSSPRTSPGRRSPRLPLVAGATVVVLLLVGWLLLARPWSGPRAVQPTPASATGPAPDVSTTAGPTRADPAPQGPLNPKPSTAISVPAATTDTPAATTTTAPATAPGGVPPGPAADAPRPAPATTTPARSAEPVPVRRPPAAAPAPAPQAPPAQRPEPTTPALAPRCSDLLQRMQLGEPLTPEQTSYFQTRCTR